MKKIVFRLACVLLAVALLGGCGAPGTEETAQTTTFVTVPPEETSVPTVPTVPTETETLPVPVETTAPTEPAPIEISDEEVNRFFDDAVFIGDSVSVALQNYHVADRAFGYATFLTSSGYALHHAINNTMPLVFRGIELTPASALVSCGAKKVFIMLGLNDIGPDGYDLAVRNWGYLVKWIRNAVPDIKIYIQSVTPVCIGSENNCVNNELVDGLNERVKVFAQENDCGYIDVASHLKDADGGLRPEYSSDRYVHFNSEGCRIWEQVLKDYVRQELMQAAMEQEQTSEQPEY